MNRPPAGANESFVSQPTACTAVDGVTDDANSSYWALVTCVLSMQKMPSMFTGSGPAQPLHPCEYGASNDWWPPSAPAPPSVASVEGASPNTELQPTATTARLSRVQARAHCAQTRTTGS